MLSMHHASVLGIVLILCDDQVLVHLEEQSPDIGQGVHGLGTKTLEEIGAGDQGHMFGYATDETEELMPLTHVLATRIGYKLTAGAAVTAAGTHCSRAAMLQQNRDPSWHGSTVQQSISQHVQSAYSGCRTPW